MNSTQSKKNRPQLNGELRYACRHGELDRAKELVAEGAEIDGADFYGKTPLHGAAEWGRLDVVQYLVERGADFNRKTNKGLTPLELARAFNHPRVVIYLKEMSEQYGEGE